MRDDHGQGAEIRIDAFDGLEHRYAGAHVQGTGGFVAQQHVGVLGYGAGDGHALLLAARELRREMVQPGLKAHQGQGFGRVHGIVRDVGDECHVLAGREAGDEVVELEDEPHGLAAVGGQGFLVGVGQVLATVGQGAAGGGVEAAQDVQQRRLAAARGAEQHDQFAGKEVQVDPGQRPHFHDRAGMIDLGQVAGREKRGEWRRGHAGTPCIWCGITEAQWRMEVNFRGLKLWKSLGLRRAPRSGSCRKGLSTLLRGPRKVYPSRAGRLSVEKRGRRENQRCLAQSDSRETFPARTGTLWLE